MKKVKKELNLKSLEKEFEKMSYALDVKNSILNLLIEQLDQEKAEQNSVSLES